MESEMKMVIYPKAHDDIARLLLEKGVLPEPIFAALDAIMYSSANEYDLNKKANKTSLYRYVPVGTDCIIFYRRDENVIHVVRVLEFFTKINEALNLFDLKYYGLHIPAIPF